MRLKIKYKAAKVFSITMLVAMLWDACFPTVSWALTSGPSQPEFSSFEPVATTNMVNEFSGDFTYNLPMLTIPGANGGGYAMSLSYHSGASPEEEASWVGYGWTLNPGAINRGKKGFPDDYNGEKVNYWNKTTPNRTASLGGAVSLEAFSIDAPFSVNASLRYNNYKGFGYSAGAGMQLAKGIISLGFNVSDGDGSFSVKVSPASLLKKGKDDEKKTDNKTAAKKSRPQDKYKPENFGTTDATKAKKEQLAKEARKNDTHGSAAGIGPVSLIGSNYGILSSSDAIRNVNTIPYSSQSYNFTASVLTGLTPLQVGPTFDLFGNYSTQTNQEQQSLSAYGYMYGANAIASSDMMDYYVEKSNPYDKRDKYIGTPFANADNYMLSGEGLAGGFRLFNKKAGHYRPNTVESNTRILNIGAEVEVGPLNIGGGSDNLGVGFQKLSVGEWNHLTSFENPSSSADEPVHFRFTNDLGGSATFDGNDNAQQAVLSGGGVQGAKSFSLSVNSISTSLNSGNRTGRSSYVAYHTNAEMLQPVAGTTTGKYYDRYDRSFKDSAKQVYRGNLQSQVGELAVYNEDGARYVYGLPVYSRNEGNMQYGLKGLSGSNLEHNYLAYKDISSSSALEVKMGEERNAPYATSYLLTEITSSDYVDRTMNGPTDDDFGGYTRFSYTRPFGSFEGVNNSYDKVESSSNYWYRWRIPYNGLLYNRGELSNSRDDVGSVVYGEKEIYYLDTIETKTHFAVFLTSDRTDGYAAAANTTAAASSSASDSGKKLKKLDRINLYAKNPDNPLLPKLIKSVRFEYYDSSGELCKNLPNAASARGKLTLKKVWFEYDGIYNAKVSPYIFEYKYPLTEYPSKYNSFEMDSLSYTLPASSQNPDYSPHSLDAWGNYQANGINRFDSLRTWLDQTPLNTFDPAAWQLKAIKLPSGGQIHVQYEQDDYAYVQDQPVEALVSLLSPTSTNDDDGKYYLNVNDIITGASSPDLTALKKKIYDQYVATGKKMYFKFLYKLIGTDAGAPSLTSCASEYVDGYCKVASTDVDVNGLYVILSEGAGGKSKIPKHVCRNYVNTQRLGNLNTSGNCDADANGITYNSPKQVVLQLMNFLTTTLVPGNAEICTKISLPLSYLRIPITKAKKGGGIRVKRLLMYDEGMESGDKALFGSEYNYILPDGSSSGVAVNEPSAIREENALVQYDPKKEQGFINKILAGKDREEHELPLGESILPSASVGYSRIVIKNIHSGKTNTGFIEKEFYTAKEFPVSCGYTSMNTKKDFLPIPGGLINYFVSNLWTTQGFVFKLNSMHGQPRSETTYAGDPLNGSQQVISSQQVFTYFSPGEKVPMMHTLNNLEYEDPGKETELTFESRKVSDVCNDLAFEFDIDVGIFLIPLPQFSTFPAYTYTESQLYTHATTKVISYPAIQKSVLSYADGIYHLSENVAFNPHTGKPMVTRTTDGFDKHNLQQSADHKGDYLAYTFPASQQYKDMGQKAKNERKIYSGNVTYNSGSGKHWLQFSSGCPFNECSGDLILVSEVSAPNDKALFNTTDSIVSNKLYIQLTTAFGGIGNLTSGQSVNVKILRSGCTNQLNTDAGEFTTYGDTSTALISPSVADRQWLRDTLNNILSNLIHTCNPCPSTSCVASLPINKIKPGLKYYDSYANDCISMKDNLTSFNLRIYCDGSVRLTVYRNGVFICGESGTVVGTTAGSFALDPETNELYFNTPGSSNCSHTICLDLCPDGGNVQNANVVAANAKTFADDWAYDGAVYSIVNGSNKYENGMKGKWRQKSEYVYRDTIIGANASNQRTYKNAGVFPLQVFNWKTLASNDTSKWIKLNTVTKYSPDGNAMEEKDVLGIYSTAKFGYNGTQPYLVAKNASYQTVQYDGFEKLYSTKLEDGWAPGTIKRSSYAAHSGSKSWKMSASDSIPLDTMKVNVQMLSSSGGMLMKVWVRDTAEVKAVPVKGSFFATGKYLPVTFTKIARIGEWSLFEAKVSGPAIDAVFNAGDVILGRIKNDYTNGPIFIDDIRVQPSDAQMITYVYDVNTLRLLTTFDDQHFGLYYQYNAEGKLVRKMVETERGMKTITETQYHTPTIAR